MSKLSAVTSRDEVIAALTLWAEARSEPAEGQVAVVWTMINRAGNPRWWGGPSLASVCLKPWQFSSWNRNDPQRARMLGLLVGRDPARAVLTTAGLRAIGPQLAILRAVMLGEAPDPTGGATHYLRTDWIKDVKWARGRTPDVTIGAHSFYRPETIGERPITRVSLNDAPAISVTPEGPLEATAASKRVRGAVIIATATGGLSQVKEAVVVAKEIGVEIGVVPPPDAPPDQKTDFAGVAMLLGAALVAAVVWMVVTKVIDHRKGSS